ncbi:hypothetical protein UUU_40250 [Klebsiella pneumoniae subsp. pneumoniae DSM 30104 = JCM 1662 = NBRC 14940]|nr:hypothetical protein UUU_40250 [Klebsiella pneumoniae subsp. pneumoniae DSM 30104 = JCM 1662 = NBRC 14940]
MAHPAILTHQPASTFNSAVMPTNQIYPPVFSTAYLTARRTSAGRK